MRGFFKGQRFFKFLGRFAPLWGVWLLVWLLPVGRESMRLHFWGSGVDRDLLGQPWGPSNSGGDLFDPRPFAAKATHDAGLAYWVHSWRVQGNEERVEFDSYFSDNANGLQKAGNEALKLAERFPKELWLQALPLRYRVMDIEQLDELGYQNDSSLSSVAFSSAERTQLRILAHRGQKNEPNNAFWWLCAAVMTGNTASPQVRPLLERASRCPFYDDKSLEARRHLLQAQLKVRSLSWEERRRIAQFQGEVGPLDAWGTNMSAWAIGLQMRGDNAQALAVQGMLMRVGRLMTQGNNNPAIARMGYTWQRQAWRAGNASRYLMNVGHDDTMSAGRFAAFASKHGRFDLAREAQASVVQSKTQVAWLWADNHTLLDGDGDGLATRATALRIAGAIGCAEMAYLALWWMVTNLFLWRAQGAPSARRDRVWPVLWVAGVCLVLALFTSWWFVLPHGAAGPRSPRRDDVLASLMEFVFLVPPFLLALVCGLFTVRRHRARFAMPSRMETELQLSPFSIKFLRWFWPAQLLMIVASFGLSWLIWAVAIWRDWGNVDLTWLFAPERAGVNGPFLWDSTEPSAVAYCACLLPLVLIIWFWKWRYAAAEMRPLTQSGVRWWKETLGGAIVFLSWLYLAVVVAAWPLYHQLDRRIDHILTHGELSLAPQNKANGN